MRFNVCSVKHVNALLRCSLIVTAVALLRALLRSALLRKSVNDPLSVPARRHNVVGRLEFNSLSNHHKTFKLGNRNYTCMSKTLKDQEGRRRKWRSSQEVFLFVFLLAKGFIGCFYCVYIVFGKHSFFFTVLFIYQVGPAK